MNPSQSKYKVTWYLSNRNVHETFYCDAVEVSEGNLVRLFRNILVRDIKLQDISTVINLAPGQYIQKTLSPDF